MTPDSPKTPQEEMEIRLLALLLGELPEEEAAAWRAAIATNPELAKRHDRLKKTVGLVREVAAIPAEAKSTQAAPLQLSEERRKKLFTRFMIPPLKERDRQPRPFVQFRLVEVLSVVAVLALLAAMFLPALSKSKTRGQKHLTFGAWGFDRSKASEASPPATSAPGRGSLGANAYSTITASESQPAAPPASGTPHPSLQIVLPPVVDSALAVPAERVNGIESVEFTGRTVADLRRNSVEDRQKAGALELNDLLAVESKSRPAARPAAATEGQVRFWNSGQAQAPTASAAINATTLEVAKETTAAGRFISPTAGLPLVNSLSEDAAAVTAAPEQSTFARRYGLPGAITASGGSGGVGGAGGGGLSAGGVGISPQPNVGQKIAGDSLAGFAYTPAPMAVPALQTPPPLSASAAAPVDALGEKAVVLGDLPRVGGLFRSEPPSSEPPRLGFSLLGPKSQSNQVAWSDFDNDGLVASTNSLNFALKNEVSRDKSAGDTLTTFGVNADANGLARSDNPQQQKPGNVRLADGSLRELGRSKLQKGLQNSGAVPDGGRIAAEPTVLGVDVQDLAKTPTTPEGRVAANGENGVRQQRGTSVFLPQVEQEIARVPAIEAGSVETLTRGRAVPARALRESDSRVAGKPTVTPTPSPPSQNEKAASLMMVTDGRVLLEAGKVADAEAKFQDAIKADPQNRAADYYLSLAKEPRLATAERRSEVDSKKAVTEIAQAQTPGQSNLGGIVARGDRPKVKGVALKEAEQLRAELNVPKADSAGKDLSVEPDVAPTRKPATNAPIPQPEIQASENSFSTFSLNVSDVSFKLAAASLEKGQMPDAASVRSEEFINAFDYRDPEPLPGAPIAFAWERARYPFAHNRDLLRFSLKTAAAGRQAGRPLNIVLLLDNSGSMERADRVSIIREALRVLAAQLQPQDKLSVITFARTARLVADGISGDKAGEVIEQVSGLTPQGGTNLEDAMNLAYQTALRHYLAGGVNRVVLLTDGAANLGNVEPDSLKQKVETHRKQGVALDCFGIGWEGFNDDLLEVLSRNGDGRYGFINSPEEAATDFAGQLAGALKVAASDVKVQVEFNPRRVTAYRQMGYAKHQLTKEQFRDNTVDAAEIAAQEAGNALYTVEANPAGDGPLCTVRVRFRFAGTWEYREQAWDVPFTGNAVSLEQSSPAMRLAASASAFSEWLVASPFAAEVTPDRLLGYLSGVPEVFGADGRPKKLEWMIRQAKSVAGK